MTKRRRAATKGPDPALAASSAAQAPTAASASRAQTQKPSASASAAAREGAMDEDLPLAALAPVDKFPRRGESGRGRRLPDVPEEFQGKLGCTKCRGSQKGCWECRKKVGLSFRDNEWHYEPKSPVF